MNEKFEIFKRHFKTGFLKASLFFLIWFIVYNSQDFLVGKLTGNLNFRGFGMLADILGLAFLYAVFYYALWIGTVLIFEGKFNAKEFFKTAAKQWWFLGMVFVFQALIFFSNTIGHRAFYIHGHFGLDDSTSLIVTSLMYFNLAVGAVKIFFVCVFLITARLGISLTEGLKEKLKENWPVFAAFVGACLVFYIILLGFVWVLMQAASMTIPVWSKSVLIVLGGFVQQYGFYVIAPFIALPFVVVPSEKTN